VRMFRALLPIAIFLLTPWTALAGDAPSLTVEVNPAGRAVVGDLYKVSQDFCRNAANRCTVERDRKQFSVVFSGPDGGQAGLVMRARARGGFKHRTATLAVDVDGHVRAVTLLDAWGKALKRKARLTVEDSTKFFRLRNRRVLKHAFDTARSQEVQVPEQGGATGRLAFAKTGPKHADQDLKRAWQFYDEGKPKEALALVDETLKKDPDFPLALALKGRVLHQQGDTAQALRFLNEAVKKDPALVLALVWRATVFLDMEQADMARADTDAALNRDPKHRKARYVRALAKAALSDDRGAFDDMAAAFEDRKDVDPLGLYLLVVSAVNLHLRDDARSWLDLFKSRFPGHKDLPGLEQRVSGMPLRLRKAP